MVRCMIGFPDMTPMLLPDGRTIVANKMAQDSCEHKITNFEVLSISSLAVEISMLLAHSSDSVVSNQHNSSPSVEKFVE